MKVIDQTPFFKANGELSFMDRGKAIMQFGAGWLKEAEAQKSVMAVLEKVFDRNYTLLRNVTPAGLDARIPLILVGPTGVYVMCVTPLTGMYRAKGDQWGTISGNTFKPENPNLLTRTERMARAIQVFLQRQNYADMTMVEAVLLCSDPSIHVDSLRPIIRVVMRDALERFAISISQARVIFSPEAVYDIVNRIMNPPAPKPDEAPVAEAPAQPSPVTEEDTYVPAFALPESEIPSVAEPAAPTGRAFLDDQSPQPASAAILGAPPVRPARRRGRANRKQWLLLIGGFVIWFGLVAAFGVKIYLDLFR
jgi:hypothetical protein